MFDSLFDAAGNEWQTKALRNLLDRYQVGDPVKLLLKDFQVEVHGGPRVGPRGRSVDRYATVRGGILTQVPDYRRPELALVGYYGDLVEDETPTVSVVSTEDELRAIPDDDLVVNVSGHVWQREHREDWWRSLHRPATTSMNLAHFGPFFHVRASARLMEPQVLAGAISEAWQDSDTSEWDEAPSTEWTDYAVAVLATPDLF